MIWPSVTGAQLRAAVGRLPEAAAGGAEVRFLRPSLDAGDGNRSAAAIGADAAPLEGADERGIERAVSRGSAPRAPAGRRHSNRPTAPARAAHATNERTLEKPIMAGSLLELKEKSLASPERHFGGEMDGDVDSSLGDHDPMKRVGDQGRDHPRRCSACVGWLFVRSAADVRSEPYEIRARPARRMDARDRPAPERLGRAAGLCSRTSRRRRCCSARCSRGPASR